MRCRKAGSTADEAHADIGAGQSAAARTAASLLKPAAQEANCAIAATAWNNDTNIDFEARHRTGTAFQMVRPTRPDDARRLARGAAAMRELDAASTARAPVALSDQSTAGQSGDPPGD